VAERALAPSRVRPATAGDSAAIAALYDHHVRHGTASFDSEGPTAAQWAVKIAYVQSRGWPFLVTELDGSLAGYAYATQFRDRPAYARTCENSIYIAPAAIGQGLGAALLAELIEQARASGFHQMIAVIGGGEPASVALHAKLGFVERGRMKDVGLKFGRTLDTVYMQRTLV
jgi:L-amino acid N-acyltransferase YncA